MSWAKFDDRYDDNKKVKRAWRASRAAVGLHAMAITYCSRWETDGLIDLDWLEEKLPAPKERREVIATLVEHELFEPVDGERFRVHDYLAYNPSKADLDEKRRRDSERKARGRNNRVRTDSERIPDGFHADTSADSTRSPNGIHAASARPVPSRPDPARSVGGEQA